MGSSAFPYCTWALLLLNLRTTYYRPPITCDVYSWHIDVTNEMTLIRPGGPHLPRRCYAHCTGVLAVGGGVLPGAHIAAFAASTATTFSQCCASQDWKSHFGKHIRLPSYVSPSHLSKPNVLRQYTTKHSILLAFSHGPRPFIFDSESKYELIILGAARI